MRLIKSAKTGKPEMFELKRKLEHAIEREEFENAAKLRDQIRRMEQREQPRQKK